MNFTPQQSQAIAARGNVLVIAGAGTGKTRTLVERCLSLLLDEKSPASLEEILAETKGKAVARRLLAAAGSKGGARGRRGSSGCRTSTATR